MNILDTAVLILYFGVLIIVGIIGINKAKSEKDFLLAGSRMGYFTHVGCLAAVIIGGAATMGSTTLGYEFGISGFWFVTMMGIGIASLGLFLVKKITGYEVFTISQLLGKRYGEGTQLISAIVTAIYTLMIVVTQVIGMGSVIHVLLGWSVLTSMLIGGGIVLFYTILGGMWSITLTDIIQFVVMTIGVFFIMFPYSVNSVGGLATLFNSVPDSHLSLTNIGWDKIFQYFLLYFFGLMVSQDIWQRVFTAKNQKVMKSSAVSAGIYSFFYGLALSIVGMCALIVLPNLGDSQSAFTSLALAILPPGMLGLVLAAVCSALMSNASGALFASATLITNDIIKVYSKKDMNDKDVIQTSRIVTLGLGILAIIFSAWIQNILVALDMAYAILSGAIFVPLVVGLFWKRTTSKAAFSAIIASTIVIFITFIIYGVTSTLPIIYGVFTGLVVIVVLTLFGTSKVEMSDSENSYIS
ncbi:MULTISPECIES: sodium:solute symporter [Metabacillus]|jgi:solute:Na+ symporter, SSS family|uniref:Sodium:solute symporter n=1 Tax=Metabacillus rhizolycopersici TaxID=2875709 RepID=A0ABS7USE3_9BACI|nr:MULTISPECIES: sodium:solute symporter [Metabacillus]MBZ5751002.1 sodium:solute symporter [Metabacillus rhizolycopersici]MCM3651363.1 sodium:solute symporter [Metabacillus litoralis]